MNFKNVISITINGKEVKSITVNGEIVWQSQNQ